jgi:hypothetical protein
MRPQDFCHSHWESVTGFIIYLFVGSTNFSQPKSQKEVTLSSTEVKYVAISEAVNEVKFANY